MIKGSIRNIQATNDYSIHNRFDVEVVDASSGSVKQRAVAFNTICNKLWNSYFLSRTLWFKTIQYGDGIGTPSPLDTTLFNFLGYKLASNVVSESDASSRWVSYRQQIQITELEAVNKTITEVGIGATADSSSLCTHAMLQDMNGNNISIHKTDTDIINIYATIFVHFPLSGMGFFTSDGIPTEFAMHLAGVNNPSGNYFRLHAIAGLQYYTNSPDKFVSTPSTKQATWSAERLAATAGNGVGGILTGYAFDGVMLSFMDDSWYTATPIVGESLGVGDGAKTDFATDFYGCKNATVYVNGVAQTSGVTILENQPVAVGSSNDVSKFFIPVDNTGSFGFCKMDSFGRYASSHNRFIILKNTLYGIVRLSSIYSDVPEINSPAYGSNDLLSWTNVSRSAPGDYLYYKLEMLTSAGYWIMRGETMNLTNVRFDSAPSEGSIITIDYTPKCVAKDSNHVFDFSLEMNFGEYAQ